MNGIETAATVLMCAAVLLGLVRLVIGPTNPDRFVSADMVSVVTTVGLAGFAAVFDSPLYLDVAMIYGVLSFVGMVALARAVEGNRS
jgi:multisubunit Na+/H+ antiporter MnhF subunit